MATLTEIKEHLARYLAGDLEPAVFRNWFALALRDVHKSNEPEAEALAHAIEWAFCDAERGALPLEGLRQLLESLVGPPQVRTVAASTGVTVTMTHDLDRSVSFVFPPSPSGTFFGNSSPGISSGSCHLTHA